MIKLKKVDIYPATISDIAVESPIDHLIKLITCGLPNIDEDIENNESMHEWLKHMPLIDAMANIKTFREFYNKKHPDFHTQGLDFDFQKIKVSVPRGQVLFHYGSIFGQNNEQVHTRYTATSLDPGALGEQKSDGKHMIITIRSENIKFYFCDPKNENGHAESEVLLEKDIKLIFKSSRKVKNWYNDEFEEIYCVDAYKYQ